MFLTADVPKIARRCGEGIVTLARMSGRPIVPAAVATSRRMEFGSWDRASIACPSGAARSSSAIRSRSRATPTRRPAKAARRAVQDSLDGRPSPGLSRWSGARIRAPRFAGDRHRAARVRPMTGGMPPSLLAYRAAHLGAHARRAEPPRLARRKGKESRTGSPNGSAARAGAPSRASSPGCTAPRSARPCRSCRSPRRCSAAGSKCSSPPAPSPPRRSSRPACRPAPSTNTCRSTARSISGASSTIGRRASRSSPNPRSGLTRSWSSTAARFPLVLVNGRMSAKSHAGWRKAPALATRALLPLHLLPRPDGGRCRAAREPRRRAGRRRRQPQIRSRPAARRSRRGRALRGLAREPTGLARGQHPSGRGGDDPEGPCGGPSALSAPSHDDRAAPSGARASLVRLAEELGFPAALRSAGEGIEGSPAVYVVDTIGELGLFLRASPIVFMGGSLVPHGGQNPIEPARLSAAILHGPHVENFAEIYGALDATGAVRLVEDAAGSARRSDLLAHPATTRDMSRRAGTTVARFTGALGRTMTALRPFPARIGRSRPMTFGRAPAFWWERPASPRPPSSRSARSTARSRRAAPSGGRDGRAARPLHRNFTLGGAGKTPTARLCARLLGEAGLRPVFLTRGHGGSAPGPLLVDPARHDRPRIGDEPLLLACDAPTGGEPRPAGRRRPRRGGGRRLHRHGRRSPESEPREGPGDRGRGRRGGVRKRVRLPGRTAPDAALRPVGPGPGRARHRRGRAGGGDPARGGEPRPSPVRRAPRARSGIGGAPLRTAAPRLRGHRTSGEILQYAQILGRKSSGDARLPDHHAYRPAELRALLDEAEARA